jgi:hypothetical protein
MNLKEIILDSFNSSFYLPTHMLKKLCKFQFIQKLFMLQVAFWISNSKFMIKTYDLNMDHLHNHSCFKKQKLFPHWDNHYITYFFQSETSIWWKKKALTLVSQ